MLRSWPDLPGTTFFLHATLTPANKRGGFKGPYTREHREITSKLRHHLVIRVIFIPTNQITVKKRWEVQILSLQLITCD